MSTTLGPSSTTSHWSLGNRCPTTYLCLSCVHPNSPPCDYVPAQVGRVTWSASCHRWHRSSYCLSSDGGTRALWSLMGQPRSPGVSITDHRGSIRVDTLTTTLDPGRLTCLLPINNLTPNKDLQSYVGCPQLAGFGCTKGESP